MISRLVITFLPRSKCLLISWLHSPSALILEPQKNKVWQSVFLTCCQNWLDLEGIQFSSVQSLSCIQLFATPWTAAHRPPCPSPTPGDYSNSCPLSRWYHPTISSSVIPFFSHLQSFPASGSFQMSQHFPSGGQSIGVSASISALPMITQTDFLISLQSKGFLRVFDITVQKHQFFSTQLSL